ncbi:hypothetical protein CHUAL_001823 [Chamberlinius hualienensis]
MRAIPHWIEKLQDRDKTDQCIYDISFKPDGNQLIVAAGSRVLVYNSEDGTLIQALRAHKDLVYCVSYSKDGKRFASGSKDKHVIIWTSKLEGILKYSHNDSIQCLAYNPTSTLLASCAISDYGLWSPDQKSVQKYKVSSRVTSCSWSPDGQYLALGLYNGSVTVRNRNGVETMRIDRPGGSPAWCVCFSPVIDESGLVLAIADWNRTLSFFQLNGKQLYKERTLDFDPLCISYSNKGEYMYVSSSNNQALLYTKEGVQLGNIGEDGESWVWCCRSKPDSNFVAVGCQDGTLACYQLMFSTVHGLYKERYAYRDNMTDVIIQHLITDQRVRIKCRDLVKKIAIYRNRLAVQLPERIIVYELLGEDDNDMHYRIKEKITHSIKCNLLVVCTHHVILCQEQRLQCITFQGIQERAWMMESLIRYIKVIGGPPGREGLLIGLKNGHIYKIFLDNPFPVLLTKISAAVRCLDLSSSKTKLAVVDEQSICSVYDLKTKELIFQEPNANSVAWNAFYEDMLCFTGNGLLSIKVKDFPVYQQKLQGFVVGFCGSKVFCLHVYAMATVEIPQSAAIFQYLERNMYNEAYKVACLGVTEKDWEALAHAALDGLDFEVARKAFIRIKDLKYLDLLQNIEQNTKKKGGAAPELILADILSYRGNFKEAAKLYKNSKNATKAIEMYTDLRMFDEAQQLMAKQRGSAVDKTEENEDEKILLKKKAEWTTDSDPRVAVETYLAAGENRKAVEIAGTNKWIDMLVDIGNRADKADYETLSLCTEYLIKLEHYPYAVEILQKMGDTNALAKLWVQTKNWEEAFLLADKYPDLKETIYLPYAQMLAEEDRFLEAQDAFCKAGHQKLAFRTLKQLTHNAIHENRFGDGSYYYWILSRHCLDLLQGEKDEINEMMKRHYQYSQYADIYYAYHIIHRFLNEPFTSYMPDAIFNLARFIYLETLEDCPPGVSKALTLYALAKQGKALGAYKTARFAFDKLLQLRVPGRLKKQVDSGAISLRTKPFNDSDELLPVCYRCSSTNPMLNSKGNRCVNCGQSFVHSFVSFEILPLVEFKLDEGISDEEAGRLIGSELMVELNTQKGDENEGWKETQEKDYEALILTEDNDDAKPRELTLDNANPFAVNSMTIEKNGNEMAPVIVNRKSLTVLDAAEVVTIHRQKPLSNQYYKNVLPEVTMVNCANCYKMFHADDFELQVLQLGHCPFCRVEVS